MADMKNRKHADEIAEERLRMIAPLLQPDPGGRPFPRLKEDVSERTGVSVRSLERYLAAYNEKGFDGLKPDGRSTALKFKISQEILDAAILLRREQPSRSIPTIIHILEMEGVVEEGELKRTTLQDALARAGYSAGMMKIYQDNGYASQRFQRKHRHDLWQGDIKYGPTLNLNGKPTQTYFSCLIDDCTRYIVHGEFYDNMEQGIVEDTLRKAVMKYGAPRRLYFDNGSQYRTHWMQRACGLMGIRLLYAKPRNPQGKGKQERFNLTMEAFLDEIALKPPESLEELNTLFSAWLNECYLTVEHSALGTTPEIAFRSDSMPPRFIDSAVLARAFLHCEQRKADKSGCISFRGEKYDLGVRFAGRKVDIIFDESSTDSLTVEADGVTPFRAHKLVVGEHVAPRPKRAEVETVPTDRSRLLDAASDRYENRKMKHRNVLSYTQEVGKAGGEDV